MPVIDDFEDGDVAEWSGDIGPVDGGTYAYEFRATTNVLYSGSYSGELYTKNNNAQVTSPSVDGSNAEKLLVRLGFDDIDTSDSHYTNVWTSSGYADAVHFEHDTGDVYWQVDGTLIASGLVTNGLEIEVEIVPSADWSTADVYLNDFTGTTQASVTNVALSANSFDDIIFQNSSIEVEETVRIDDVEAPAPPASAPALSVDATRDTEIDLSWSSVGSADSYNVYRAQASGSTTADYTLVAQPGGTSYTDTGLENGERYYYRVSAENSYGTGPLSNQESPTTTLPATDVTATAGATGEVDLAWSKQDNSGDGEWELYRSQDGSLGSLIADGLALSTDSYTDTGLEDGERYHYTLRRVTDHAQADGAQDAATTILPAPTLDSLDASTDGEITVNYSLADDSSDGDVLLERSTDGGSTWTDIATVTDLGATSYTDTGLADGEEYTYRLTRRTDHASAQSGTLAATTPLPAPTNVATGTVTTTSIDVSWNVTANNGTQRVEYRPTSDTSWSTAASGLARTTTSETVTGLRNGEAYDVRVVAVTSHTESPSGADSATTDLPDEDQPQLANGVEDEIAVDRESQPTNYGSVRIHYRETGASSWIDWGVVPYDRLDPVIAGLEDGEEYEVRLRTETEHLTGTWTEPVAITTKFPGLTGLGVASTTPTSVTLEATDNADNEDGYIVERREQFRDGFGEWRTVATPGPHAGTGSVQLVDDTALPNTTYEYRVETYTEHSSATTDTVTATTADDGVRSARAPAQGWHVVLERDDGVTVSPTIVGEPNINRKLNGLPTCEIPVRQHERWRTDDWGGTEMRVYYDGERLPIEELRRPRDEPGQTTLVGRGGVALEERVTIDVIERDAHLVAGDVLDAVGVAGNIDDPAADTSADVLQAETDDQQAWLDALAQAPDSSSLYEVTSQGELRTRQAGYWVEAEDADTLQAYEAIVSGPEWSGTDAVFFDEWEVNGLPGRIQEPVEVDHDIPAGEGRVTLRLRSESGSHPGFRVLVNDEQLVEIPADFLTASSDGQWLDASVIGQVDQALGQGDQTVTIEFYDPTSGSNPGITIDGMLLYDDRYDPQVDQTSVSSGYIFDLDLYPELQIETADVVTVRQVTAGRLEAEANNTTGPFAVAISNDQGGSWIEAANQTSVEGEFASGSSTLRARFTLGGYNAEPLESPKGWTQPQSVDLYSLYADLDETPLLANRSYSGSAADVLVDIADYANALWEVTWDDGITVQWTMPGQRTADIDPDLVDFSAETDYGSVHRKAVIKGNQVPDSTDSVTADVGNWVALDHDWLAEVGEVVTPASGDTEYERGVDYELRPNAGELKALSTGSISDGESLAVEYDRHIVGEYESEAYDGTYPVLEESLPAVTTKRNADQAALTAVRIASDPITKASVTVPDLPPGTMLVDALSVMGLPVDEPLEQWDVDNSPRQTTAQLGSRDPVEEALDRFNTTLRTVAGKV